MERAAGELRYRRLRWRQQGESPSFDFRRTTSMMHS